MTPFRTWPALASVCLASLLACSEKQQSPTPATFSISGRIFAADAGGITVLLEGPETATETTAADGSYTFRGLSTPGTYRITPTKSGQLFTPSSVEATVGPEVPAAQAPPSTANVCTADGWCWVNPFPEGNQLRDVWFRTATDGWAVGEYGTVLHWDGGTWSVVLTGGTIDLGAVWGSSATDVWAVGLGGALHWDGVTWSEVSSFQGEWLYDVWGTSATDAWATGTTLLHWDGTEWVSAQAAAMSVWGSAANDYWAVGTNETGNGEVQHWDGSAWTNAPVPLVERFGQNSWGQVQWYVPKLNDVWGSATDDVWAVGGNGTVLHWDGTAWSNVTGDTCGAVAGYCCDPDTCTIGEAWTFDHVSGSGRDDVWVAGSNGWATALILHWDGSAWSSQPRYADAVAAIGPGDVWTVTSSQLDHWDGGTWTSFVSGPSEVFEAIWGSGPSDAWAVGASGVTLHWDGAAWSATDNPLLAGDLSGRPTLKSVWGTSPDDVWAVGEQGTVLHWNGQAWSSVESGTTGTSGRLVGVWASGPDDAWAVTERDLDPRVPGLVLHWDGAAWTSVAHPAPFDLAGVWGTAADDVWVLAGANLVAPGGVMRWDGTAWTWALPLSYGEMEQPAAIGGSSGSDVWVVGRQGPILHWDGAAWTTMPDPLPGFLGPSFSAVWSLSATDAWLATEFGRILHWDGVGWTSFESGVVGDDGGKPIWALWGPSASDVWAAGNDGMILRHKP